MTKSPILWGVGLACALGGAIAGNALGSTPPLDHSIVASFYQTHDTTEELTRGNEPLPDHYPLVTKAGTVPVTELSMRGLYSQRRYRAFAYAADYGPSDADFDEWRYREDWRPQLTDEALAIGDPVPEPVPSEAAEPLQLAARPASLAPEGQAKTVDVNAALAMP